MTTLNTETGPFTPYVAPRVVTAFSVKTDASFIDGPVIGLEKGQIAKWVLTGPLNVRHVITLDQSANGPDGPWTVLQTFTNLSMLDVAVKKTGQVEGKFSYRFRIAFKPAVTAPGTMLLTSARINAVQDGTNRLGDLLVSGAAEPLEIGNVSRAVGTFIISERLAENATLDQVIRQLNHLTEHIHGIDGIPGSHAGWDQRTSAEIAADERRAAKRAKTEAKEDADRLADQRAYDARLADYRDDDGKPALTAAEKAADAKRVAKRVKAETAREARLSEEQDRYDADLAAERALDDETFPNDQ